MPDRFGRLRAALLAAAVLAMLFAVAIACTGGFVIDVGGLLVTSRQPRNPFMLACLLLLAAWALPAPNRLEALAAPLGRWANGVTAAVRSRPWLRGIGVTTALCSGAALAAARQIVEVWLRQRPLWLDEQMIAINVRDRSMVELASGPLWMGQSAPFGWLALERVSVLAFGTSEQSLRFVPLLFGLATLATAVWIARRWLTPVGGVALTTMLGFGEWVAHYALELKHYSADVFWALLLPAMAVRVASTEDEAQRHRRLTAWWVIAAVGLWCANGAVLIVPVCAVMFLVTEGVPRHRASARRFAPGLAIWVASFAAHYAVSARYTLGSEFLRNYWHWALPPQSGGLSATLAFLAAQFAPLAANPAGALNWRLMWALALLGAVLVPSTLARLCAGVIASAFVFGGLAIVPLADRLALWMAPALYILIALACDAGVRMGRLAWAHRQYARVAAAVVLVTAGLTVTVQIVAKGYGDFAARIPESNNGTNDRAAIAWLTTQAEPGDIILTTHLGLPAPWWYAPGLSSAREPGGALEVGLGSAGPECNASPLGARLAGRRRLLVHLGFPDGPPGFDTALLDEILPHGAMVDYRRFAERNLAVVIDLTAVPDGRRPPAIDVAIEPGQPRGDSPCVIARAAVHW